MPHIWFKKKMFSVHLCSCSSFFIKKENKSQKENHTSLVPNLNVTVWGTDSYRHQDNWEKRKEEEKVEKDKAHNHSPWCSLEEMWELPESVCKEDARQSRESNPKHVSNNIFSTTDISIPNSWFHYLQEQLSWRISPKSLVGSFWARKESLEIF